MRESKERRAERARQVAEALAREFPEADCALRHADAYQLLAATILSAQCTDARVNLVTPELFRRWPSPSELAGARQEDVEGVVRSTGFYRNKARNLIAMARRVSEVHGGAVPCTMEELTALPGVARKTANVLLGTWFRRNDGVVVDTHVGRIARKLGLTSSDDPVHVERDLMDVLPRAAWTDFSHRVILHGRRTCVARKPRCAECPLRELCPGREDRAPATPSRRAARVGAARRAGAGAVRRAATTKARVR